MHTMKLQAKYFDFILNGTKKYEIRLNDEKRRLIKIGDSIEFLKEPDLDDRIVYEVSNLLFFDNFSSLFDSIDIKYLADSSVSCDDLKNDLEKFYPIEKQLLYGVVAIELKK